MAHSPSQHRVAERPCAGLQTQSRRFESGPGVHVRVAQWVERFPEKEGVGGSIPSPHAIAG